MFRTRVASGGLPAGADAFEHAHDVALLHDQEILAVDLDLGAGPFAEKDAVAGLHIKRNELAALVTRAGAHGDDFALLRLLFCGVGNDDPALGLLFAFEAADDHTVVQRTKFHEFTSIYDGARQAGALPDIFVSSRDVRVLITPGCKEAAKGCQVFSGDPAGLG